MPANTTAEELLAEGTPVTLSDGRVVSLRYTTRGLMRLEEHFDTTLGIDTAYTKMLKGEGQVMHTLVRFLDGGLAHLKLTNGNDKPVSLDTLEDLIDAARLREYIIAIADALPQAFGTTSEGESGKAPATTPDSPGPTGTTSPPSDTDAATTTSGT